MKVAAGATLDVDADMTVRRLWVLGTATIDPSASRTISTNEIRIGAADGRGGLFSA